MLGRLFLGAILVPGLVLAQTASADDEPAAPQRGTAINVPPPPPRFLSKQPLPNLPSLLLDTYGNSFGTAQKITHERYLQARILWVDATANISRTNSEEKIVELVRKIKFTGFNTVVVDIKPIVGQTIYPSKYASKLTAWRNDVLPLDFDPLAVWVRECKSAGLSIIVSMNAFSEGHRDVQRGLGYDRPDWQTVLYEPAVFARASFNTRPTYPVHFATNVMPPSEDYLGVFTDITRIAVKSTDDAIVVILDSAGKVVAKAEGQALRQLDPNLPSGGSYVLGIGKGAQYLRLYAQPSDKLEFDSTPSFVKIQERPLQQIPLMVNPNHPSVQQRMIEMVKEVVTNYAVDGVVFDDRLRYAGINADFSEFTKREFEAYLRQSGMVLQNWPQDILTFTIQPNLTRGIVPGPLYEAWLTFRAQTITNWVARVRRTIEETKPGTLFGVYAGSWYGEYPSFGSNYASDDFSGAFWFLRPEYQKTGYAHQLDMLITGCYYRHAGIADAMAAGVNLGISVEAGGQQSNRAAGDMCWTYAGIMIPTYQDNATALGKAVQAAVASSQGVMVFDLVYMDPYWEMFRQAFITPMRPPHMEKGLLDYVRTHRDPKLKAPATLFGGSSGTGL
jgi:uncharacterized lipoprotein YddW (UPF0748 family)